MKQIINMQEQYGSEVHTRQMIERLRTRLNADDDYLLDMQGIQQISRSAADELYNLTHGHIRVEVINIEPLVEKMLSAVTLGRFLPRQRTATDLPIVECKTIGQATRQLTSPVCP